MAQTNGRGQIIEKGKDKWLVRIFRGRNVSGKKLYFSKVINGKKSVAQKYLTGKLREKDLGIFIESSRQTLDEHLDYWLKTIKTRVARQTYDGYEIALRVHVRPRIGQMRLADIKIHDVQTVYAEMEAGGSSARTVRSAHTVLSMAMKKAVQLDYIVKNPCDYAELPKQVKDETKAFSPQEASLFLQHAKNNKHSLIFELALLTGMRPEEYLALRWSDIDLKSGIATVQRVLVWHRTGGGWSLDEPKTKKSRRNIPLPDSLTEKLKKHRKKQLEYRLGMGGTYQNNDFVFASELGTPLNSRNLAQRHFDKILKDAGLDNMGFVLYSLRHTCATLLLVSEENPKVVSDRLGHSSVKMTLDTYSHVLPGMQENASNKLEAMLYRKSGTPRKI
jgi:integrase